MAIVTIARERGAFGRIVARKLAENLGAKFIDKDIVDARLEELGITQQKREAFDERKPGVFASLTKAVDEYVSSLKQVLFEEAADGNCVLLGRGSQVLFRDVPNHVGIRLIGTPQIRYDRVAASENIPVADARLLVDRVDRNREGFNNFFFDADWRNPLDYDAVINTDHVDPETVTASVKALVEKFATADPAMTREVMDNLVRAQRIERRILHIKKIPVYFLRVRCEGKICMLNGIAHSADVIEQACEAAEVEGIEKVQNKIEIGLHGHYEGRM